ncbi:MAG: N-glycosylase/DNA lyase [Promethearchaeota archaeon]|nr:MAG: N-glycosylase/DNA lyase [Candidatus Lokiarchaeota archaeon]
MKDLINSIQNLKNSEIAQVINSRMEEFSEIKKRSIEEIFVELCFCIMTANCGAEKCIEIHDLIGSDFLNLSEESLVNKFKEYGYRFPNVRANYIINARSCLEQLSEILFLSEDRLTLRHNLVKTIKGLGYKESSHFLRNIGFTNYAIIDFHIVDLLQKYNLIEKPKTMTKKKYHEIEEVLMSLGEDLNLNMAELDLYLWYLETGKVLK